MRTRSVGTSKERIRPHDANDAQPDPLDFKMHAGDFKSKGEKETSEMAGDDDVTEMREIIRRY